MVGAITAAVNTLSDSAAAAFSMLQLLQAQHHLPLPLLQLLWTNFGSPVPPRQVDVSPCLNELVDASLLYKVHKVRARATVSVLAAHKPDVLLVACIHVDC